MTADTLKVCHVGIGYWGPNLMRNVAANATAELTAVCDLRAKSLQEAAEKYPDARLYDSMDAVLADPDLDALVIATPSGLHYEQAKAALSAKKHVFVEKPLAETVGQAQELTHLAASVDRVVMVGHTFLFNNLVHEVKDCIDSGELGEIFYAYSQRLNLGRFRTDSDVMWTLAPHDVSILNYWFDASATVVRANGQAHIHPSLGVAEVCFANLEYPHGRSAHLHLSWLDPQKRREMVVVGSKKMLVYDDMNAEAHIRIYDKSAEAQHQSAISDFADFTTRLRAGGMVSPQVRLVEPLSVEIAHFVDCCRTGSTPVTDGRHAIDVIAVLEAMERSMKADGAAMYVERPDAEEPAGNTNRDMS